MNDDYNVAVQMIEKFNAQPRIGDVQIGLDQGDYGLLYNAVITMQTTEVKSRAFKDEVEVERDIYSKIQKLQSGGPGKLRPGSFLTDVRVTKGYGLEHDDPDTITIYIHPKQGTEGIEGLKSFLSLVSSISQEITGGDVAQRDLPGLKEGKIKITKEQLREIIKEEISNTLKEVHIDTGIDPADIPSDEEAAQMKIDDQIKRIADPLEQQAVRDILAGKRSDFWSLSDAAQYILDTIKRMHT